MKVPYFSAVAVFLFLLVQGMSLAQPVVTIPLYPTDIDSCTVIFDATKGNGELANVPPPIYAHTGVVTTESVSPADWKYVIAGWSENTPKALMTPLGNNLYQIKFKPSIRAFYDVPAGEAILKLAFVFRNSDGSKVGREADGGDIFWDVYPSTVSVNITLPQNNNLLLPAMTPIPVAAVSPLADSMFLFVNNILVKKVSGTAISDTIPADNFGHNWTKYWVSVRAKNDTAAAADSVSYTVIPGPAVAELPAGLADGINYIDSSSVILSLYAPEKEFCFAIGDFNDWQPDSLHYMNVTPAGDRYWVGINGLEPGQEYVFQYLVDGSLRIADPYADKVSDPNDQYIPSSTYPGLIPYPSGKTTGIAAVLQTSQIPYPWDTSTFIPPQKSDLVIYELLLRDFLASHDYPALEDTLDYLKRLGINAIELMPVMEFEGNESWGYNPDFMFAPDKYYGTKNALKHFIETAHSKGIAVILDIVLNHQFGQSPLVRLYWDAANNRPAANSPWFNVIPKHPYNVGFDFNHDSPDTKAFCKRVLKYWISEYHVDGFRFDLSKGFTQVNSYPDNVTLWGQYDGNRVSILTGYLIAMRTVKPDIILILEHFADNTEEKDLSDDGMLLWGNLNYNYAEAAMGYTSGGGSNFSWVSYKERGWFYPHLVGYMESHDEERQMYKCVTWGNSLAWYSTKDTNTALQRIGMNASFFFTVPGPKMIWEFGELGYDYSIDYGGGRLAPKPPRWDYRDEWRRGYLNNIFTSLIGLKKNEEVFKTNDFSMDVSGALKRIRLNHPSMNAVVIGNFDVLEGALVPGFQNTGTWYDYFSGDSILVDDLTTMVNLSPGEYHIYTSRRLQKPLFTGTGDPVGPSPGDRRALVFPNPSAGILQVKTDGIVAGLELYGITGRLQATSGSLSMDISDLSPGFYFLVIRYTDGHTETLKVVRN